MAYEPGKTTDVGAHQIRLIKRRRPPAKSTSAAATTLASSDASETSVATEPTKVATASAEPAANAKARSVTIQGKVLDPAGKPVAGAAISVPQMVLEQEGRTDQEERFQVRTTFAGFPSGIKTVPVIAYAKGFGAGWKSLPPGEDVEGVTLRLTKDEPIRGRIVDMEGGPVANARIDVTGLLQEPTTSAQV